nr:MucBP domain-containing protein [Secundilactobacillus paracollinoides]
MYKDGKKFVFAAIATLSFFVFGGVSTVAVHADQTTTPATPVQAGQPTTPATPVQAGQLTTPATPVQAGQPTTPATPVQAGQPTTPATPVQAGQLTTPATPVQAGQPTTPATPVQAGQPTTPATPVQAGQPTTPATPVQAGQLTTPATPVQAGQPTTPATPVQAGQLTTPATPVQAGQPTTPATPVQAGQLTTPATPVQAGQPTKSDSTSASKAPASDEAALTHVDKDNFTDYFRLNGSATYDAKTGIVTITPDQNNEVGNFSLTSKIDMNKNFTLTGQVNLGSDQKGADGIGFAFHSGNTTDLGNAGSNLGIGGLQDAIGFKLDTYFNPYQAPLSNKNGSEISPTDSDGFGWNGDSAEAPYGTFVDTDNEEVATKDGIEVQRWWAKDVDGTSQALSTSDVNGQFHDFTIDYDGDTRTLTIKYTPTSGKTLTWTTTISKSNQAMAMIVSASTGGAKNLQQFKIDSFDFKQAATVNVKYVDTKGKQIAESTVSYPNGANVNGTYSTEQLAVPNYTFLKMDDGSATGKTSLPTTGKLTNAGDNGTVIYVYAPQEAANVTYIDDTTGKTLSAKDLTGDYGSTDPYRTGDTIADYEKQGYQLVSDKYPTNGVVYDQDGVVKSYEVHLTHGTTPVGPNNPQTPGEPINPDEPDGPKWPISTNYDKTVNETVSYVDQNGHVVAKQHTDSVNFTRTVVVDNVTGEVITSGAGTTAWTATNGDTTFDAVVSPVVPGSVADKAQTAAVTDLNADSADVNETVTYTKVGSLVPSSSDGNFPGAPTVVYPNDPSDATKVTPAGVPTVPGYTAHDPEGNGLTPGSSYQPSDPTKDTTITYTADKQKGSVSYVDDTTGKTLKTDSISGTTGSKSSYSTSGSIADYKKQGYELVTDGYPADLTFDNDDTTDQNFTVHLKHQLTSVNPTDPQTPGAPINPDEPDGPKWPTSTNYDKTVNETVSYVDQNGHVVAKQHTDSVNFTRTVVVDNVTGEVITSGAGTTAWTATNGDTTFDAVVSPVVPGSVADKAQTAAVTDLNADSADVNETVTYTKVGSLVPSSSDGNFPGAPTVVYPNDPSDATKVTPAGVPTVPGYTAHDPEGNGLTPGSSYQPSDPTKDTTITYTADKQKGSVSYVDDTTGKTLKTDSISGTTGSKSSYSTSGSIADYKKQGYELVTDGYPADLTFDNDDTTDQNFTVHLKHQLTSVNPTDPQTPGAPINPDEPDGPKWPTSTNYDKTVNETVSYVDQNGHVVAKPHTDSVNFTRTVVVDNVTGEVITSGAGTTAWTATNGDTTFDAVVSPVVPGSVADKAQTAAVTDLNADSADVNETVTYTKVGSLVPSSSDGNFPGAPTVVYPNDPSDATKVTPAGVPTVPGYTAHDPEGNGLTPGSSYQPSDPTKDTTITYTADKQKGSVSYVDDTTGKTLKTDSISGTTGSKSSYSTSGSIADYKKQGYELVTDGYPADLTFDNDDTTDQNFTVHLKHQLTSVNPTDPQTPGAPINPDEPDGPKWPTSTNYDKTVNETVSYVDQNGHVVAKPHTDSVNFTRTVVVDNVTGEVITSGAGTTAWTATNGDTTFDAVVSPVVPGSVADKAQTAAVTDLNADSADVNETVTYTKVGSLVPSSSDGNFPGAPTVVYPNDPSDATKVTPAGVPTVPGYTAHDPEGNGLTPGSSYQPSDPTKDTTITYTADKQKGSVSYVDDTTGKTLKTDSISGTTGSKSSYSTSGSIADYKKQGYELVTDGYPADLTFDNDDTTDQNFTVHLKHQLTSVNPTDPQTPGAPINPDEPDGPKWPEGTDKSSVTQTVIRTVNYLDKQTGKVVAKQVTEQVTYNRTAIVDKVTGQIIGYSTTGGDTVDQTDGDKAWTAVDNKSDWDSVTSPDLSSKGYLAPDLATVAQQTVTPGDKDVTVNVYYDHDVVPVNPTNPQTPGTPINPDDPDSPKWPAGTDKNSLTTDVHQTIHYQYGDGSQAAPDKTDSTTFDHQVEIDKVTGEIVKDDGWTAENGKTSFDSKNSPVIPGYTASKPASDSVDGLTQDSKDNVQTIVYAKTPVAGGNVTAKYVDENGNPIADDVIASGNVGDPYSTTQKDVPGYTFKEVQGNPTGSFTDQDQTVTYVYTKNPATDNTGGTGSNQPGKPGNGTDTGNPSSNQPGNPSQPSNATNNGVINTSTNTGSKVNNGAVNSPELPQTGENNSQSQTMSFIGILLAMFGSLLGFLGIKKRRND